MSGGYWDGRIIDGRGERMILEVMGEEGHRGWVMASLAHGIIADMFCLALGSGI